MPSIQCPQKPAPEPITVQSPCSAPFEFGDMVAGEDSNTENLVPASDPCVSNSDYMDRLLSPYPKLPSQNVPQYQLLLDEAKSSLYPGLYLYPTQKPEMCGIPLKEPPQPRAVSVTFVKLREEHLNRLLLYEDTPKAYIGIYIIGYETMKVKYRINRSMLEKFSFDNLTFGLIRMAYAAVMEYFSKHEQKFKALGMHLGEGHTFPSMLWLTSLRLCEEKNTWQACLMGPDEYEEQ